MKIFCYEHITGGGLIHNPWNETLARDGRMMIHALVRDLLAVPGVEVITSRDPRMPSLGLGVKEIEASRADTGEAVFARGLAACDAAWPVAPETGGVLEKLCAQTLRAKRILLNSRPRAVRLAASKFETARALKRAGIAAAETRKVTDAWPASRSGWIVKPDDGAGCENTRLFRTQKSALEWVGARAPGFIVQPYVKGQALSLSMLCREGRAIILSRNLQHVDINNGVLGFHGCRVNGIGGPAGDLDDLGQRIAAAVPELWGYVGVDLVRGTDGFTVLEINPRLTTSYAGLREALKVNPAQLVLRLLEPDWDPALPRRRKKAVEVMLGPCSTEKVVDNG